MIGKNHSLGYADEQWGDLDFATVPHGRCNGDNCDRKLAIEKAGEQCEFLCSPEVSASKALTCSGRMFLLM